MPAAVAAAGRRGGLGAKNCLTATDAKLVEDAFERRLSEIPSSDAAASSNDEASGPEIAGPQGIATTASIDAGQATGIDKSALPVTAPRPHRHPAPPPSVAQQACRGCGQQP